MRKWLALIRKEAGKSQQTVANEAGISQSYYAGIESETRGKPLSVDVAKKIAAALDFDWVKFYEDRMETDEAAEQKPEEKAQN